MEFHEIKIMKIHQELRKLDVKWQCKRPPGEKIKKGDFLGKNYNLEKETRRKIASKWNKRP